MKISRLNKPGFALPTLLMITGILLLLATAIAKIGFSSMRVSVQDRETDQALFAAEAGLVAAAEEVTRAHDLQQPFEADLPNGATYSVVYFKNETTNPVSTVKGIQIPPGTAFLHSTGTSAAGRTRHSGILLKVGSGLFRVGALGTDFNLSGSTFDSYSSETGAYPGSILEDAMIAASNGTTGTIFEVANSTVEGGIFVGPGADAGAHISADATSNIVRQGSLNEPIEVDALLAPNVPIANVESEEEGGEQTFSVPDLPFTVVETESGISLDLDVASGFHMTIAPDGEVVLDNNGGDETATGNIFTDEYGVINQPGDLDDPASLGFYEGGFVFRSRDGVRMVILSGQGELSIVENSQPYYATVPWMAGLPPSVTNPDSLVDGEYENVTINSGTTDLVGDSTIVVENLNISSGGSLSLPSDTEGVEIYVTGSLTVDGQDAIVNNTRKPPNLNIYYTGDQPVALSGGSHAYFTLFAPEADVTLAGESDFPTEFFGALVGNSITVHDANFHFDQATLGIGQGISGTNFRVLARTRY